MRAISCAWIRYNAIISTEKTVYFLLVEFCLHCGNFSGNCSCKRLFLFFFLNIFISTFRFCYFAIYIYIYIFFILLLRYIYQWWCTYIFRYWLLTCSVVQIVSSLKFVWWASIGCMNNKKKKIIKNNTIFFFAVRFFFLFHFFALFLHCRDNISFYSRISFFFFFLFFNQTSTNWTMKYNLSINEQSSAEIWIKSEKK